MAQPEEKEAPTKDEKAPAPKKPKKKLDNKLAGDIKKKKKLKKTPKKKGKAKAKKKSDYTPPKKHTEKKTALEHFGHVVSDLGYKDQLVFFLNAMWSEHGEGEAKQCEEMYGWACKFEELGENAKNSKHDLDDFQAARFLEANGKTMTVIERRTQLREIDIDQNNRMGMLEWLVYHFKTDILTLMNRPQGTNAALKSAEKALKAVLKEIKKIEDEKK